METFEYKNKKIEFEESSTPKVSIDGEPIHVNHDVEANQFDAAELPYHTFKSIKELAKAIIEQRLQNQ